MATGVWAKSAFKTSRFYHFIVRGLTLPSGEPWCVVAACKARIYSSRSTLWLGAVAPTLAEGVCKKCLEKAAKAP